MDSISLEDIFLRPTSCGPPFHFFIMRLAVLFLAVFATFDFASSLTLDQPPSLRPSVSSFAISSPAGIRQVNAQDQKQRATASRISSIRGGSSGLLASAGGILTSAAVVGASNLIGFAFTIATGSVKAIQHLIPHFISSHLISSRFAACRCINCPITFPAATEGLSQ